MKRLLNTLYVLSDDVYLTLDGENIAARRKDKEAGRIPLHTLESVISFSYAGASPALMGACAERGIALSFFSPKGKFLARSQGLSRGNVLLRKEQYRLSDNPIKSIAISRNFITGKIFNSRWVLERALRDHGHRINSEKIKDASQKLKSSIDTARKSETIDVLRGIEGDAAAVYFGVLNELILREKESFEFKGRTRRPPRDPVNAMLSLFYTVLANDCISALEGVGLDPFVGMMHVERPGRASLALDLIEELRAVMVDRFILSSINNRIIKPDDFEVRETGEVRLMDSGRKTLFNAWQERKRDTIIHPFLKEKIPWGLVPHVQSLLLSRCIRGDLEGYPPFLWK